MDRRVAERILSVGRPLHHRPGSRPARRHQQDLQHRQGRGQGRVFQVGNLLIIPSVTTRNEVQF